MVHLRLSRPSDGQRIVQIWRSAVDATHDFLSPEDRLAIEVEVASVLPAMTLWLAVDEADQPLGFMALSDGHMDALFIAADQRGRGIGRALVEHAIRDHALLTTDVNEQNTQAIRFYEGLGFEPTGRSTVDDQGRPYPLIHMRLT